jgi:hypothetical protein
MLSLRDLQKQFDCALFDDASDAAASLISGCESDCADSAAIDAQARIAIYRNNLREGFRKALALEFPVIERLVGDGYFRQLALWFQAEHPSRAGDLHPIGAPFAQFLHSRFADTQYAYLPDVARLEWAYQQASVAADAPPFDPAALRNVPQEAYGQLRFVLHPACGLLRSPYPIVRIWAVNQPGASGDGVVDLSSGADYVLVRRAAEGVEIRRITESDFAILDAFSTGAVLADVLDAAFAIDPGFNLGAALRRFIGLGVLAATPTSCSTIRGETSP